MALTMAQAAARETKNQVRRGALEIGHAVSTVWDRLPFESIQGNAYAYDKDRVLPGTAFRTVNEAYVESTGTVNQATETLVILGGDADVDRFLEKTMPSDLGVLMADQVKMKIESAQSTYVDAMFNGDTDVRDPKEFDGLRKRLVNEQVIDAQATLSDDKFLEDLDLLFEAVNGGPDVVYTGRKSLAKLKALGRRAGGAEYVNSEITGKREWTWNGVSFVNPGNHWSGRPILDDSEMFAVKFAQSFGDEGVMGITNGGLQAYKIGEMAERPAYRTRIEFYSGLVVQGGHAAARLRNIRAQ